MIKETTPLSGSAPVLPSTESLAQLSAYKAPGAFLRALLLHLDGADRHRLHTSLAKVEREQKCICRAMFWMLGLLMICLAALSYCAILLPEVWRSPSNLLIRGLLVLCLGSLISQGVFFGYLVSHRAIVNRLHIECRRLVLALAQTQQKPNPQAATTACLEENKNQHDLQ